MAKLKLIENGVKRAPRKRATRKRSNPRKTTIAQARATAKQNGLKLVKVGTPTRAIPVANPRKRRKRSTVASRRRRRNNGIFGDTKETVTAVLSLGGGMVGTKIVGGLLIPFVSKVLTPLGVGSFSQVASEALVSILAVKPVASKVAGRDAGKFAMLGGLTISALDAIDMLIPSSLPLNPFAIANANPVLLNPIPANISGSAFNTKVVREIPLH